MLDISDINARGNQYPADSKPCIVETPDVVKVSKLIQVNIGHGEGDTRWKGCPWKPLLFKLDIINNWISKTILYISRPNTSAQINNKNYFT